MSGAYIQARMNHNFTSRARKPLRAPDHPLALRQEYVTTTRTSLSAPWCVSLPGAGTGAGSDQNARLASAAPRLSLGTAVSGNFNFTFRNVAAQDVKGDEEEEERNVVLEVERYGNVLESFDVVYGDRKVAEVKESVRHNRKIALRASSRRGVRPVLEAIVTPGVDLSVIAVIAVIASDSVFGSE